MKGPFRELMPVGAQEVRVRVPQAKKVKRVRLLGAELTRSAQVSEGYLAVQVPGILDHEVIAIDLE
jgi:hypothetical protein